MQKASGLGAVYELGSSGGPPETNRQVARAIRTAGAGQTWCHPPPGMAGELEESEPTGGLGSGQSGTNGWLVGPPLRPNPDQAVSAADPHEQTLSMPQGDGYNQTGRWQNGFCVNSVKAVGESIGCTILRTRLHRSTRDA